MKKIITAILFVFVIMLGICWYFFLRHGTILNPLSQIIPKPLLAYTFEHLKKTDFPQTQITFGEKVAETSDSFSQMFYFSVPKKPGSSDMEKVSGLANFPSKPGIYPVIVMFRGFIPQESYKSGAGTEPSAEVFAKNGFITLAPDFLGFGQSASPSADSFEDRFQTYTTALSLLASLPTINTGLANAKSGYTVAMSKIGIWGHSNGGHIALSALAISGVKYPTVLWAPVSASFPYSILYYTDESDDQGKALRKVLSQFEELYDTDVFSPPNYYTWIQAPVEIHQGLADEEVPYWWTDTLVATLKKQNLPVSYFTYPGADHNLLPDAWSQAVIRSVAFYQQQFAH
ncbi:MAG: alpha/beta hydrolase family protein [Candidatus Levyibacteriota bacterium]